MPTAWWCPQNYGGNYQDALGLLTDPTKPTKPPQQNIQTRTTQSNISNLTYPTKFVQPNIPNQIPIKSNLPNQPEQRWTLLIKFNHSRKQKNSAPGSVVPSFNVKKWKCFLAHPPTNRGVCLSVCPLVCKILESCHLKHVLRPISFVWLSVTPSQDFYLEARFDF